MTQPFVSGSLTTAIGAVPRVSSEWKAGDRWGAFKVRWGIGRMRYTVVPGLYALGDPTAESPVLVSANYKLSFDWLRRALPGIDAWVLVLDTDGINVWCSAGKGTFGTAELVERIEATNLDRVVDHRELILPQLGAPGVAAHEVARRSGFEIVWGPIRAEDLPAFLAAGHQATPEMRRKGFPLIERAALVPMELVPAAKVVLPAMLAVLLLGGVGDARGFATGAIDHGLTGAIALAVGLLAGAVLTPLLLPWLPGPAFALRGAAVAAPLLAVALALRLGIPQTLDQTFEAAGWLAIGTALAAFLAMNFTGASTFTSLSGVRREMRIAVPLQAAGAVVGLGLWLAARWLV